MGFVPAAASKSDVAFFHKRKLSQVNRLQTATGKIGEIAVRSEKRLRIIAPAEAEVIV